MQLMKQDLTRVFIEPGQDWSSKAIIAALDKKGVDLQDIEKELGLKTGAVRNAFYRKCVRYQEVIAQKIGVEPDIIWPSRYVSNNKLGE
ncbi:TPA: helix-turn-helix domain-containing protein [Pluralibacter gergoviae]|uniref:helix-turn-helix domain-containing protein n=1 Tax=Pluralibacter gergoviae TaxID=61647 RepID=UPI002ED7C40A